MKQIDNFKEKPKRQGWQSSSPIDFVVPLQLEECMYRIKQLPPRDTFRFVLWNTDNADVEKFWLTCDLDQKTSAKIKGTLKRWEGTHTRFEGKAQIINPVNSLHGELALVILLPLTAAFSGMLVYTIMSIFIPASRNFVWNNPLLYAVVFAVPILWLIVRRLRYKKLRVLEKFITELLLRDKKEL
ncbi:MAG TPA: hypothetical protein VHL11_21190 [Phototrophicaceae bacterium]|jgi:hypothetical protein|nr:hypothetical protein [Phototrophicaceae bacterium]